MPYKLERVRVTDRFAQEKIDQALKEDMRGIEDLLNAREVHDRAKCVAAFEAGHYVYFVLHTELQSPTS